MPHIAVVTQVNNEDLFLPLWRRYYGGHFGYDNLIVIDDGSTDHSTENLAPTHVVKRPQRPFDERERADEISLFLDALLKLYDWVIYTDVDEFLVLDPLIKMDFSAYLGKVGGKHLNAVGINVLHNVHTETEYSRDAPVLHQRRFGVIDNMYCKQLIHSHRVRFTPGFHWSNRARNFAPGLYLLHLARFDKENTRRRWMVRNGIVWTTHAMENGHSVHFRVPADAYVAQMYSIPSGRFADAATPAHFMPMILSFLARIEHEASSGDTEATGTFLRQLPILQFPERFRDIIPAVMTPLTAEEVAVQAPADLDPDFDPDSLYRAVCARVHKRA